MLKQFLEALHSGIIKIIDNQVSKLLVSVRLSEVVTWLF